MRLLALTLIACIAVTAAHAKDTKKAKHQPEVTLTGYLVDVHCAKKLMEKNDIALPAKQHERSCDLMPECAASGYGMFVVVNKTTTHASDVDFYKFDAEGNKKAKAMLEKSTKKDDMLVTVHGRGTVAVEDIEEMK